MACLRSRDNWHSYVKKSLSAAELQEMSMHLEHCAQCREIVSDIRETSTFLASNRVFLVPPGEIHLNIMQAIDKTKYQKGIGFSRLSLSIRHLGFSLLSAGFILLAINLNTAAWGFESVQMADMNFQIGKQIALPFDHMGQAVSVAVEKIGALNNVRIKN